VTRLHFFKTYGHRPLAGQTHFDLRHAENDIHGKYCDQYYESAVASAIPGGFAEVISSRIVDKMSTLRHEYCFFAGRLTLLITRSVDVFRPQLLY